MSKDIDKLQAAIIKFRDRRDWKQFHNPKDVALSLVLEASELMEHFQWKSPDDIQVYVDKHKKAIGDELADVLYWVLLMSHDLGIDLVKALMEKIRKNERKYPVKKARGKYTKYTEL